MIAKNDFDRHSFFSEQRAPNEKEKIYLIEQVQNNCKYKLNNRTTEFYKQKTSYFSLTKIFTSRSTAWQWDRHWAPSWHLRLRVQI